MSTTIDERVVEMRFDNQQFERNVQTSLSTLDKLKQSLNLDGAAKGLEGLGDAAKKCDLSKLGSSVEAVQAKFSAFQVMAMTALSNITNSAVNAGKRMLSTFTVEPISQGFDEYELKMGSVQTIMASTGESLDVVNQKLDELNTYSDKTIYSFSDMTSNIGKFTNAGVKLNDAVAAIQGVSNVAAVSGANANEASRAMYNFAQALSAGYVKLIDWKSIENANMATVEFKNQLLDAAVAAGTVAKTTDGMYRVLTKNGQGGTMKETIDATHMFNDSLAYQWMTTEVLTNTLKDYADETTEIGKKAFAAAQDVKTFSQLLDTLKESAQSGWAETWQLMVGDYEEAKATLREFSGFFSEIIEGSAEARNSLLKGALTSSWGQLKDKVSETGISVDAFRTALRETANESVTGFDKMVEEAGSFDNTLSKGWLTTDILAKTLDKLANEATGTTDGISALTDEQLKNIGYTEEQIKVLRTLSDEAKTSTGDIAELVANMTRKSGRELLFDALLNSCKAVQKVFETLKGAWDEVFPPATSKQLYGIIEGLNAFSQKLILSDETASKIGRTFKGLFAVLDIVRQAFSAVFKALSPLTGGLGSLGNSLLDMTASFGDWLVGIDEAVKKSDVFNNICQSISGFVELVATKVKDFFQTIRENFKIPGLEAFHALLERVHERMGQIGEAAGGMGSGVCAALGAMGAALANSNFLQALLKLLDGVKAIAGGIIKAVGALVNGVVDKIGNTDFSGAIDLLNGFSFGAIAVGISKFLKSVQKPFDEVGGFLDNIKGILDGVRGCLEAYQTSLKADTLLKIAGAIGILAAAIVAVSLIDSDKLSASLGAVTVLFADLMAASAIFSKISGNMTGVFKTTTAMLGISTAVLILASALKKVADLDMGQIAKGLTGIAGLTAIVVAASKALGGNSGAMMKGAVQMVVFAGAIKILASVCTDLSELDWNQLAKGLTGVGVLMGEVSLFLNTAKFSGKSITTATGIVILAGAIKILASACADFGQMDWGQLGLGLAAIGGLLLEVAAFTKLTGNAKHVAATGLALIEIGAAMKIFASAMSDFAQMDWGQIAKGLAAMGGALAEVAIAVNLMPKGMVGIGAGLVVVGAALEIMANVLGKLGSMQPEEIGKSLITLGGALAELAIGLNLMNGTLGGSAAMLVAAGALAVLTPVLVVLGSMSWEGIAKGLVTIAGAFAVLGVAGAVLTPLVPTILGLAGAFALIGAGVLGIGAGLMAAGAGLSAVAIGITALAASLAGGVTAIVAGLTAIITGIAALIPAIAEKLGEAIVAFCGVIADGAPAIGEAIKAVVLTTIDVLTECVPAIASGALELIAETLDALASYTPQIVDSVMQFLINILEGIASNLPELIQAAVNVFAAFFSGIVDALAGIDTSTLVKTIAGVGLLSGIMVALSATAALVPGAMAGILGLGAVIAELAVVLAAVGGLAQLPGLSWLIGEGGKLLEGIGTAIGSLVGGIVGGFMSGVSSQFPQIGADLASFMTNVQPFIDGASSIPPAMLEGVKALTEVILLLTAADILDDLTSWLTGGSSLSNFAEQLVPFGEAMRDFSQTIAGIDGSLVANAATAGKTLAEMAATLPNSGGVVGFFAGENDMDAFGEQLVPFGEAIKNFSLSVKGMDTDAVANSVIAGKAMVELANTLPNCGGVVGFFTGENDLDTFGEKLVPFGASLMAYSEAVKGLDANTVANSATAGKALVELANTIPNCGGLVSFFTGDNNIATFGNDIVSFGKDLAAYADAIKDVNPNAVSASANAASALSNLAAGLPNRSLFDQWFGGDQTLSDFGDDIADFGEDMGDYYSSISSADPAKLSGVITQVWALVELAEGVNGLDTSGFSSFGESLKDLAEVGLDGFTDTFYNCGDLIDSAVVSMLTTVSTSITSNQSAASASMDSVVLSLTEAMEDGASRIELATGTLMSSIPTEIASNANAVKTAIGNLLSGAIGKINSTKSEFETAGKNVGQGFINGINSKLSDAATAGRSLGLAALNAAKKALDSHSPSREFIHLGENIGEGLAIGVKNSIVPASSAASGMIGEVIRASEKGIDAFEDWVNEKNYYGELSMKDELAGWENLQKKYVAGSEKRKKVDREVYRLQNALVSSTYQASMDWIEEEKYYHRLSLSDELAAYERVQARYLEGSEERKKADREVFRLRNELMQESYQTSMDWIENEKYYNRLPLADELAAYKRVQSRYAQGTEERKKMDREVYRLEKEISDAQKQYVEDVQRVQEDANRKRMDLEQQYADKVEQINDRLAQNIKSLNDQYQNAVESRTNSLYRSYGLFDKVSKKDAVSSETLMKNLEGQVQEFGEWQDILDGLSARGLDKELISELQEMGPSAIAEIKALNSMSDDELEKYAGLWGVKHAQAREQATSELEDLRIETKNNIAQLREEADEELDEYRAVWSSQMAQLNEDTEAELERLRKDFAKKVGLIKTNTEAEMKEMAETAQAILKEAGWNEAGQQIVTGLSEGVESKKPGFIDTLTKMAMAGVQAVKDTLEINSPSRVFRELGGYTGLGFIQGLNSYATKTYDAGSAMADSATSGLSNAIQMISDLIENGIDSQPTIRPVLDLSNVTTGANTLNSLLSSQRALGLVGEASLAFRSADSNKQMTVNVDTDGVVDELHNLRDDVYSLGEAVRQMRIVLDTGTLVGELAEPMDTALGQKAIYRGRRN